MIKNQMILFMHQCLQEIAWNQLTFGGKHMVFIGDLHQLKPVFDGWIFQDLKEDYGALAPDVFKENFVFLNLMRSCNSEMTKYLQKH